MPLTLDEIEQRLEQSGFKSFEKGPNDHPGATSAWSIKIRDEKTNHLLYFVFAYVYAPREPLGGGITFTARFYTQRVKEGWFDINLEGVTNPLTALIEYARIYKDVDGLPDPHNQDD